MRSLERVVISKNCYGIIANSSTNFNVMTVKTQRHLDDFEVLTYRADGSIIALCLTVDALKMCQFDGLFETRKKQIFDF